MKLVDVNRAAHQAIEALLVDVGAALMRREAVAARAAYEVLAARLGAHLRLENDVVMPRYATLATDAGAGAPKHVASDHLILDKHLLRCAAVIDGLAAQPTVREALLALDPLLKLHATLEHHDEREERFVYPLLEEALDAATRDDLAARLSSEGPA